MVPFGAFVKLTRAGTHWAHWRHSPFPEYMKTWRRCMWTYFLSHPVFISLRAASSLRTASGSDLPRNVTTNMPVSSPTGALAARRLHLPPTILFSPLVDDPLLSSLQLRPRIFVPNFTFISLLLSNFGINFTRYTVPTLRIVILPITASSFWLPHYPTVLIAGDIKRFDIVFILIFQQHVLSRWSGMQVLPGFGTSSSISGALLFWWGSGMLQDGLVIWWWWWCFLYGAHCIVFAPTD